MTINVQSKHPILMPEEVQPEIAELYRGLLLARNDAEIARLAYEEKLALTVQHIRTVFPELDSWHFTFDAIEIIPLRKRSRFD